MHIHVLDEALPLRVLEWVVKPRLGHRLKAQIL